jgi:hypothetical protein
VDGKTIARGSNLAENASVAKGNAMTECQRLTMRDMLETHREQMLERAERCERIAKACRAVAEKDTRMIVKLVADCDASDRLIP